MRMNSLFSQIVMIAVAVAIALLYIKPTISEIKKTQDSTDIYKQEITKVADVNQILAKHVATVDSVPLNSKQALLKYIPDSIDEFVVLKDLRAILTLSNLTPTTLAYTGEVKEVVTDASQVSEKPYTQYEFSVGFDSTYENLKNFLSLLERSDYLLEVADLKIKPAETGLITVNASIRTYTRAKKLPEEGLNGNI